MSAVLLVAMVGTLALVVPGRAGAQGEPELEVRGFLSGPDQPIHLLGVDGQGRLFGTYQLGRHLVAYDLTADEEVPPLIADMEVGGEDNPRTPLSTTVAFARDRDQIFAISTVQVSVGATDPASAIRVWDIADLDKMAERSSTWVLAEHGLPGFFPQAITYSAQDGLVYLVGYFSGVPAVDQGFQLGSTVTPPATPPVAVAALDATTGQARWVRPLPRCHRILTGFGGGMVARSSRDDSLYAMCQPGGAFEAQWPGQPRLVRVHVDPEATPATALDFAVDYIPVPGHFAPAAGSAVFSEALDRVFVNSLSTRTPGTFVFDGERSAWVGHVATPTETAREVQVDGRSGRLYLAASTSRSDPALSAYLIVTDGGATPPPQARPRDIVTHDDVELALNALVTDPGSDRIFALVGSDDERYSGRIAVIGDTTTTIDPLPPTDHDANTADVAEGPDTFVNYTVVSSGFGALGRLVGGAGNVGSYGLTGIAGDVDPFATLQDLGVDAEEPVVVSQGDRTVVVAEVPSVQLAAFGATGDAQALATDDGTSGEINEGGAFAGEQGVPEQVNLNEEDDEDGDESQGEDEETAVPVTDAATSPYRKVECSDNGFDDDATERSDSDDVDAGELEGTGAGTGHARVVCDLAGQQSRATASWRAGPAAEDAAGPAVAAAGFDTHLSRDPEQGGAGTETVAVASGIELPVPEVGTLHIGEVRATAVTVAAGRPGTTKATWTRTLSGVVVTDPDGGQVFPPEDGAASEAGSCATVVSVQGGGDEQRQTADNCQQLVEALDAVLQPMVTFELPDPDLAATPLGAYAQVRQTEGDYRNGLTLLGDNSQAVPALQVLVANDGTEKSRLLLHLAAIDTSTIYQIQPCPFCSFDGGTDPDPAPDPTSEQASPTPAATVTGQPAVGTAAAPPPTPTVSLPVQQPEGQSIDLAAAQPSTSEPEVAPQQALSLPGRIGAGLQLLTRDPVQALLVGGVWLLFAGALTTLLRRIRLRQLVSS